MSLPLTLPSSPVPVIGKSSIKKSLSIKDLKTARRQRNEFSIKVDAEVLVTENSLASSLETEKNNSTISFGVLIEHLLPHVAGLNECKAARLADDPPEDEAQRNEMKENADPSSQTHQIIDAQRIEMRQLDLETCRWSVGTLCSRTSSLSHNISIGKSQVSDVESFPVSC